VSPLRRSGPFLVLIAALAGGIRCSGGDSLTLPPQGLPSAIEALTGDAQTGVAGHRLPDSLLVRLTDSKDRPVQAQRVEFRLIAGGSDAVLIPDTAVTDADGRAWAVWVLGGLAGEQRVEARVISPVAAGPLKMTFTATAMADAPDTVFAIKGQGQSGTVGALLADSLAVVVTDRFGNPLAGQTVSWSVPAGQGSVSALSTPTGADGRAAVTRTLGPSSGGQSATATVASLPGKAVVFSHTAVAAGAVRLVKLSLDGLVAPAGSRLADSLVVQAQDINGNGVPGQVVTWAASAGGFAAPNSSTTNAEGKAHTFWTLGTAAGPNTLTAAAFGVTAQYTATGTATTPDTLRAVSASSDPNGTAGQPVAAPPSVRVSDQNGNAVQGVAVAFTVTQGGGTVSNGTGTGTTVSVSTGASGVATLAAWTLGTVAGPNAVTASATRPGGTALVGSPVSFTATGNPGPAAVLVFGQQPTNEVAGVAISPAVTVLVQDALGNLVTSATTSVTVAIGANPGGGILSGAVTATPSGGVATFSSLSINKSGTGYTLTAGATGLPTATSAGFNITPAGATKLGFLAQPTNAAAGATITPAPQVAVQDQFGNTVTSSVASIAIAIGTNPSGATLSGTTPVAAVNGVATFSNLSINKAGTGYTLTASSGTLTQANSQLFNIGSSVAAKLSFLVQPTSVAAGTPITPAVQVEIQDANGNRVTSATDSVILSISTNPGGATLSGGRAAAVNGVASFPTASLDRTGTGYKLTAASGVLASAISAAFDVTPGTGRKLAFTVQPSSVAAGAAITPAVQVTIQDAIGNTITTATDSVFLSISTNPGGATLTGGGAKAVAGIANFPLASLNRTGTGYILTATSAGAASATSNTFNVTPGAATKLVFGTQPSTATAGAAITPAVTVQVQDANSNVVTTSTATIAVTLGNPGTATLSGTTTLPAVNGVATFSNLSVNKSGTGYTLVASSAPLTSATSASFVVNPAGPAALAFVQQPTAAVAGAAITPAVTVQLLDALGNLVTGTTTSVTMTIGTNPGTGILSGATTATPTGGIVTFANLAINKTGTGYTLVASATGLAGATSSPFNVTPGSAAKVAFGVQPSSAVAGVAIAPAVTVQVQDANSNLVTSSTATVAIVLGANPGGSTLSGTASLAAVNGVATFSTLSLNKTGTGYNLVASSGTLTSATSSGFNITPASASQLAFTTQPANTVAGSVIAPPIQVALLDAFGNTVTTATTALTLAIGTNPASGVLSGTTTVSAVAGVATFSTLSINKAGTGYTLTADDGAAGLPATTSAAFNITAGSGNRLAFLVQPTNAAVGTAITPAIQIEVRDAVGNRVTTATDAISLVLATNPGGGTLTGAGPVNAIAGVATFSGVSINRAGVGYTISALASGLISATSASFNITAAATTTAVTSDTPDPTLVGQPYTVGFSVTSAGGTPSGNVTVSDGAASCTAPAAAGSCSLASTTPGTKNLVATYTDPSGNFQGSTSAAVGHTVNKGGTTLALADTPDPSVVGQLVTVSWSLSVVSPAAGTPAGTVTVTVSGGVESCSAAVATGSCQIQLLSAGAGNRTLTATYAGDANFNGSSDTDGHALSVAATTTTITGDTPDPSTVGQGYLVSYAVAVTAPGGGTPTGNVSVSDGAVICSGTVAAGGCTLASISAGSKTLTASYAGDANYSGSLSAGVAHVVGQASTTTTITSHTPNPSVTGQGIVVGVTVTSGGGTPTGSVTVSDGTISCPVTLTAGAGSCTLTPTSAGARNLTATYAATANFLGSTSPTVAHTVNPATTTISITGDTPDPTAVGQGYAVSYAVAVTAPGAGTPTGNVTVNDGSVSCTAAVAAGSCTLSSTSAGGKGLTATYVGDASYAGSTAAVTVAHTVNKAATVVTVGADAPDPSIVGQAVSVPYTVAVAPPGGGTPTGNVTVSDGTVSCTATVAAGSCSLTATSAGAKTLTATYAGDANYEAASGTAPHQVNAGATTATITADLPDPSVVGQAYTVSYTVAVVAPGSGTPTGNVTVNDGTGVTCTATVAAGSCSLTSISVGARNLTATYAGDANFGGSVSATVSHTVNPAPTTTTITGHTPSPSVAGQDITVSVTVTSTGGTPTGNVTVSDGTVTCPVTLTAGAGSCILTPLTAGTKTLTASYPATGNFAASTSLGVTHVVNTAGTTTTITGRIPTASVVGQAVAVSFTVTSTGGIPTGNVTVTDGTVNCTATVAAGTCTVTPTSAGSKTFTASYAGDAAFAPSTSAGVVHVVSAAATTTTITADSPDPSVVGQAYAVSYSVAVVAPGAGTPTGSVTVSDGTVSCTAAVAAGGCSISSTTTGTKSLTASYVGDANFAGSLSGTVSHLVNPAGTTTTITGRIPTASVVGQAVAVSYTVTSTGGTPSGNVTVTDGTVSCSATVAAGTCTLSPTSAGSKTFSASYTGDGNFSASTSTGVTHVVSAATTATTITADSPDPSAVGQAYAVSYTVAVAAPGSGTPTGNVTVSDGAASCTAAVAAGGCALTSTSAGARNLTASYTGDANFTGSVSVIAAHTVSQAATTTTITGHTPSPTVVGQAYTVSFSVAVTAPGAGTPTGNVTVSDGTVNCTATVAAGSCQLTSTTAGAKSLVATYAGDASFAGSASAPVIHQVDPFGQAAVLAFTVQPGNSSVGVAITPAVQVSIRDGFGNLVTSAVNQVNIALGNSAGGQALLAGTLGRSAVGGVASFDDLIVTGPAPLNGLTLLASSTGLSGAESASFNIRP
jgi:hypothetical protein